MKLAVNHLLEVEELFNEGKIDFVDYFKLYSINADLSHLDWCTKNKPLMFHGLLGNGSNIIDDTFWNDRDVIKQKEIYKIGHTPHISVHINKCDDDNVENEDVTIDKIKKNVKRLKDEFEMSVLLENVPARYDDSTKHIYSNPDFISRAVNETGCEFLFDIGHARVAADVLGIPFNEYVDRLPMDKLVEVHLSGIAPRKAGGIRAPHKAMNSEDYEFLEEAIKRYKTLKYVTLEYGTFVKNEENSNYPIVSYEAVNEVAKKEVYEQLTRIKNIIGK